MLLSLKKLYRLLDRRDKAKALLLFGGMILGSLFEAVGVGAVPAFILAASNPEALSKYPWAAAVLHWFDMRTSQEIILRGAVVLILIFLFKNLYLASLEYFKGRFVFHLQIIFGNRLFDAYLKAPYAFHLNRNSAVLLRNTVNEVRLIVSGVLIHLLRLAMDALMIVAIVALLLTVEPVISLAAFGLLGLASVSFLRVVRKKILEYAKLDKFHRRGIVQSVQQGLGGLKEAKVLGREDYFINKYREHSVGGAVSSRYREVVAKLPPPFIETIGVAGMLSIALILVYQERDTAAIVPLMALFGVASMRLMPAFREAVTCYTNIRFNLIAVDSVYDDLKLLGALAPPASGKKKAAPAALPLEQAITIEDLHYGYPGSDLKAINGISLKISHGSAVAFVGPTGAGKTTLVDVLLGLLVPDRGTIRADNIDIFQNLDAWHGILGYVPQFIFLSDDSIRRNVAFGLEDHQIDDEKLQLALEAAQMVEFVERLPKGLETVVGERGVRLSGGQRQRIGIARALYMNPKVLIMDEATSSLDNVTERYVIDAIDRLRGDRTIIMIAHRLTTVQNCDRLYFMKEGVITASGSYQDLMQLSNEFKEMAV